MTEEQIIKLMGDYNNNVTSQILADQIATNSEASTYQALYERYNGDVPILSRTFEDENKINRQIANDFRGDIVDNAVGYMFGKPIQYSYENGTEEQIKKIQDWLKKNNIEKLDAETGEYMIATGYAGRLLYNVEGEIKVMNLKPWEFKVIRDSTTDEVIYAMIYYQIELVGENGQSIYETRVEWYDKKNVYVFVGDGGQFSLDDSIGQNPIQHTFDFVPVIDFENNSNRQGDFVKVESLIDAYDIVTSDSQNEFEEFRQAYMIFKNAEVNPDDVAKGRKLGVINIRSTSTTPAEVSFLTKQVDVNMIKDLKETLNRNIYKFSGSVDMSDEKFSGQQESGISRLYKIQALENKTVKRERYYIQGLREMFKVLFSAWSKQGLSLNYLDMAFKFNRNLPSDMIYIGSTVNSLKGTVSDKTLLGLIPGINVEEEIKRKEEELTDAINLNDVSLDETNDITV